MKYELSVTPQLWWYVARAGGIVAWGLTTASVLWGIFLSSRVLGKRPAGPWLLDVHRYLGGLAVLFTGIHVTGLVADSYTYWGPSELFVPLATTWKPVAVAWGIAGLYVLVAIEVTSLLMRRLPKRFWRAVHASAFGLYVMATVHLLTAGTDRRNPVLLATVVGSVLAVVFGTAYRLATLRSRRAGTSRVARPDIALVRARLAAARATGSAAGQDELDPPVAV